MKNYTINGWLIVPSSRTLSHGKISVTISPKAMSVLNMLALNPDRVVSRTELLAEVWKNVLVGEEALTHAIAELRKAFKDSATVPRFIKTVPKTGYHLIGEVGPEPSTLNFANSFQEVTLIQVTKCRDLSPLQSLQLNCDAVTQAICSNLNDLDNVLVSELSDDGSEKPAFYMEKGKFVASQVKILSSLQREDDRLRATIRFIDGTTTVQLASFSCEGFISKNIQFENKIIEAVREHIKDALKKSALDAVQSEITNLSSAEMFQLGRFCFDRSAFRKAIDLFSSAVRLEPEFYTAYPWLVKSLVFQYLYADPSSTYLREARRVCDKLDSIKKDFAEGLNARGLLLSIVGSFPEAETKFKQALQIDPHNYECYYFYARAAFAVARFALAEELFLKAMESNSECYTSPMLLIKVRTALCNKEGMLEAARIALQRADAFLKHCPEDDKARIVKSHALIVLGQVDRGLAHLESHKFGRNAVMYYLACTYAVANKIDVGLNTFRGAVQEGWSHKDWALADPDIKLLRAEEGFQQILEQIPEQRASL